MQILCLQNRETQKRHSNNDSYNYGNNYDIEGVLGIDKTFDKSDKELSFELSFDHAYDKEIEFVNSTEYQTERELDGLGKSIWYQFPFGRQENSPSMEEMLDHPVVCVTVSDVLTYCQWFSQQTGDKVNLERSAQLGGRLGGHIVQGHVDGTAIITSILEDGTAWSIEFEISNALAKYIVEKGFICVDGVSLTVVNCDENVFSIALIPYTRDNTVLGLKTVGSTVNIETDIIGKYLEKLSNGDQTNIELA